MKKRMRVCLVAGLAIGMMHVSYAAGSTQAFVAAGKAVSGRNAAHALERQLTEQAAGPLVHASEIHASGDMRLEQIKIGNFSQAGSDAEELLAVFELLNTPHTGGLNRKVMALFSKEGELLTYQVLNGDSVDIYDLKHEDGTTYMLVSLVTVYQGVKTQTLTLYHVNGRDFQKVFVKCLELADDAFAAFAGSDTLVCYKKTLSDKPQNPACDDGDMEIYAVLKWDGKGQFAEEGLLKK